MAESPSEKARAKKEFRAFLYLMWRFLQLPPPTRSQLAFADYLQYGPKRKVLMAFRGVGKSWVTAAYVIWCLWRNPQEKILIASASEKRAVKFSSFVKQVLFDWEMVKELHPRSGQRSSILAFDVAPAKPAQSMSVMSVGITGQMTGDRAHRVIFDDVEVPKNSETTTQREKIGELVREAAALLVPDKDLEEGFETEIIYLGTPQTEDTLYVKLPDRGYSIRIWPARYPDQKIRDSYEALGAELFKELLDDMEAGAREGDPTDPDRFDEVDLLERAKEYGPVGWQLQFMLNPSLSDAERYPLKLRDLVVAAFDHELVPNKIVWSGDREYTAEDLVSVGLSGDKFQRRMVVRDSDGIEAGGYAPFVGGLLTVDPSGRGKDSTSWNVTKVLNGQIFLVAKGRFRGDGYSDTVLAGLAQKYVTYGCNAVRIESNFGDGMFTRLLSPHFAKVTGRGLDPEDVDFKNMGIQKEARIIDTLEPVMAQHKLIIHEDVVREDYDKAPREDPDRRHHMLFHQMTRITRDRGALKFDDDLDCLAMAVHYHMEAIGKDIDEEVRQRREDALDAELKAFSDAYHAGSRIGGRSEHGIPVQNRTWGAQGGALGRMGYRG